MSETADATPKCTYCGFEHIAPGMCPHVRAIEYHPDGTIKRVEFGPAPQYVPVYWPPQQPSYPYPSHWPIVTSVDDGFGTLSPGVLSGAISMIL